MSSTPDTGRLKTKRPSTLILPSGIGMVVSAAVTCKQPFTVPQFTTLNEHYSILAEESIGRKHGKDFQLAYFGVGIGGSRSIGVGNNGLEGRMVYEHSPTDNNAFLPVPLIARLITDDLDPEVRKNYRIRDVKPVGDQIWVFYYLKLAGFQEFDPSIKIGKRDPNTGNQEQIPYIPKKEDLTPKPQELATTNAIPVTDEFVNGTGKIDLSLNENDLQELRNACRILYGDSSVAAINEIYMAYGVETTHNGPIGEGGTVNYNELTSAIVAYNITEAWARDANANTKIPFFFWYGNSVPLLIDPSSLTS